MEVDHVSGSEPEEEKWEHVDEVRRVSMRNNCEIMGHFARVCRRKGKGKEKGEVGGKGYAKEEGKRRKARERQDQEKLGGSKGRIFRRTERFLIF